VNAERESWGPDPGGGDARVRVRRWRDRAGRGCGEEIGDDFLPRRIEFGISFAGQSTEGTQDFAQWGEPVEFPDAPE
jgi:hypothetical protein